MRNPARRFLKLVSWSDEDGCYVGRCPGLFLGGVHGSDEAKVCKELCGVVDEHPADLKAAKNPARIDAGGVFHIRPYDRQNTPMFLSASICAICGFPFCVSCVFSRQFLP